MFFAIIAQGAKQAIVKQRRAWNMDAAEHRGFPVRLAFRPNTGWVRLTRSVSFPFLFSINIGWLIFILSPRID